MTTDPQARPGTTTARWIVGQITCLIVFLVLLAVAIWHKQLGISHGATKAVIAGCVAAAVCVLVDFDHA